MDSVSVQYQERFHKRFFKIKSYHDSPDGEDLDVKLLYTTKIGSFAGLICGVANAYWIEPIAIGHKQRLFKAAKAFIPCVGMAAAFTIVTYFSTNIRKKDDELNYFLGGCAAGSVIGLNSQHFFRGFVASVAFGLIAVAHKMAVNNGTTLFPGVNYRDFSSYYLRNWDFTLLKDDIRGNWTRDPK